MMATFVLVSSPIPSSAARAANDLCSRDRSCLLTSNRERLNAAIRKIPFAAAGQLETMRFLSRQFGGLEPANLLLVLAGLLSLVLPADIFQSPLPCCAESVVFMLQ